MAIKKMLGEDGWCLIYEVTMYLTSVTPFSVGDSIRNYLWPLVAKPLKSIAKFGSELVSPARAIVSFPECLLHLFV